MRPAAVVLTGIMAVPLLPPTASAQESCPDLKTPRNLPTAGALLDSARAVAQLTAYDMPPDGMAFTLLYDGKDSLPRTRPLGATWENAALTLAGNLRPRKRDGIWAVRVHVVNTPAPALRVVRSSFCPPRPITGPAGIRQLRVETQPGDRMPAPSRRLRTVIEVQLTADGDVVRAHVAQPSGVRGFDEEIRHDWETRRYTPARLDGVPVASRYRSDGQAFLLPEPR